MGPNSRFAIGISISWTSWKNGSVNGNCGKGWLGRQDPKECTIYESEGPNRSLGANDSWFYAQT